MKTKTILVAALVLATGFCAFRCYTPVQKHIAGAKNMYRLPSLAPALDKPEAQPDESVPADIDSSWYAIAKETIKQKEYNITFNEEKGVYQSPNRKNNLRFYYNENGFSVQPRDTRIFMPGASANPLENTGDNFETIEDWRLSMTIAGFGRTGQLDAFTEAELNVSENSAIAENNKMAVRYTNTEAGMRQDFIVKTKPSGNGFLTVALNPESDLNMRVGADKAVFSSKTSGNEVMSYSELKVWDANGKELRGWMEKNTVGQLLLVVNDEHAAYPVTIDPLSASPSWTYERNSVYGYLGYCVGAGDFNGDGYSDVAISEPGYDASFSAEGAVFVFMGASTGLPASYQWMARGDQFAAQMGSYGSNTGISSGDFNGDGFSDLIVGMPLYDAPSVDEGVVCVFLGSSGFTSEPTGTYSNADWTAQSDFASGYFGSSVSAGDFNGDGRSDIIVGSYAYQSGVYQGGIVCVWYGDNVTPPLGAAGLISNVDWLGSGGALTQYFGWSVSGAGDVNGDGYGDLVVGAKYYSNGASREGGVFVWGGSSTGLPGTGSSPGNVNIMRTLEGVTVNAYMGTSVYRAGDVNGDGYGDIIVGTPGYANGQTDEGCASVYMGSSTGTAATPAWKIEGNVVNEKLGINVAQAGDVNGDGYSDVMIGSVYHNIYYGMVSVYNGSKTGLSTTASWSVTGPQQNAEFGGTFSPAGDVNGDGYSDIIIGSRMYTNGQTNEGKAYVYQGSPAGLGSTNVWAVRGSQTGGQFAYCISYAGDVNGDGYSDVVVAAPYFDNGLTDEGMIWVYLGSANGLLSTAYWSAESNNAGAAFGLSVAGAGDVDGNGYADIIVGAPYYSNDWYQEGAAFVWLGSASGFGATGTPANADWYAEGDQASSRFGTSVASAGNVNWVPSIMGYSDIIIGAPLYDHGQTDEGMAFMWHGSATGLGATGTLANADWTAENNMAGSQFGYAVAGAGDVNNDGHSDVIVGCPLYTNGQAGEGAVYEYNGGSSMTSGTSYDWRAEINVGGSLLGEYLSTAGDVNGDRYSDIIVGAYGYANGQSGEGGAFVWHGSSTGLSTGGYDWKAESDQAGASFGDAVSTAGDVNGDGYSDVIVGAYLYSNGQTSEGKLFAWYGSATGLGSNGTPANVDWSAESDVAGYELGLVVAGGGDVNGDGFADVLSGARNAPNHSFTNAGQAYVYYGNEGPGLAINARQMQTDFTTPLAVALYSGGISAGNNTVGSVITARSFYGRMDVVVNREFYEMVSNSVFTMNSAWSDVGLTGNNVNEYGWPLLGGRTRWRQRFQYRLSEGGYQTYGHWYYLQDNGVTEQDFYTCSLCIPNDDGQRLSPSDVTDNVLHAQNYPNPFTDITTIGYTLPALGHVTITVYTITGELVSVVTNNVIQDAGEHAVAFDGSALTAGTYFYTIQTENETVTQKMVLVK